MTTLWRDLGRLSHHAALAVQEALAAARRRDERPDTLLLVEHPPTVTLGRRAVPGDLGAGAEALAERGIEVVTVGRGGGATYHGPGQLVGYPIARVGRGGRGVRAWVGALERVLVGAARALGAPAVARPGRPGAWVGEAKIGALGIEIHHGVSRHGFALNVAMDLEPFDWIVPCRMPGLRAVDVARAAGRPVTLREAKAAVLAAWAETLGRVEEERAMDAPGVEAR